MSDDVDALLHDSSSLYRFIDFVNTYCREQSASQVYLDAASVFFSYIGALTEGIKKKLTREVDRVARFPSRLPNVRSEIITLKNYLRLLHTFVKPVADAHTLNIPAPLIQFATAQLSNITDMHGATVVVLLTPELMYFQRPHTGIKQLAGRVRNAIPEAAFPDHLGFVELPYSQGPSFFTNLAIYHEIGHFVYEDLSNRRPMHPALNRIFLALSGALNTHSPTKDPQLFTVQLAILDNWAQEIFCDLFALRLVGPAFSFALMEILTLLGLLTGPQHTRFSETHPAHACRLSEHIQMWRSDGWAEPLADLPAHSKSLLEHISQKPRTEYEFYLDDHTKGSRGLVEAFEEVLPTIRHSVRDITADVAADAREFIRFRHCIKQALGQGVVPSVKCDGVSPDPVSIINAGFFFYLTEVDALMSRFDDPDQPGRTIDLKERSLWSKRIEMWTMKALEDSQLISGYDKRIHDDSL